MVVLHVKRDSKSAFLFETRLDNTVAQTTDDVVAIYNGRLKVCKKIEQSALLFSVLQWLGRLVKVLRVCNNIADLAEHGVRAAPAMDGLLEEQGLGIQ